MTHSIVADDLQQFLADTIKSEHDLNLEHLQTLLDARQKEQKALDSQLSSLKDETKSILETRLKQAKQHHVTLEELSSSIETTEQAVDQAITLNQTNSDFFNELSMIEQKLRTVDHARTYLKTLLLASELSSQALSYVQTSPEKAMTPYVQLVQLEQYIHQQSIQQPHYDSLHVHVKKTQQRLSEELEAILVKNFKTVLDDIGWPTQIKPPYGPQLKSKLGAFKAAFHHLIQLQKSTEGQVQQDVLLIPVVLMLDGLSLRFRFHFEGSKPTNRADKPEWYLAHTKNTIASHIPFIMTTIQPILDKQDNVSIKDQFIQGFLVNVDRKLQKSMPQLMAHPNWLSHTMHELLEFDKALVEEFAYRYPYALSQKVTENSTWFQAWFQAEKSFAQSRYDDIMLDREAFDVYAEDAFVGDQQPSKQDIPRTKSAVRLVNLLENITAAYQLVPGLHQKLMFFVHIQLNLIGQYQKRLSTAIDSFEALSLIRSVPVPGALPEAVTGVMTSNEKDGTVSALYRLHRWWTSARSMRDVLKDWNEDDFFLELQLQFNQYPEAIQQVVDRMPLQERNNCMLNLAHHQTDNIFSDALTAFDQLIKRIEKIIVKIALKEWSADARKYAKRDAWWQSSESANSYEDISDELYKPLQDLRMTLNYLHRTLPQPEFLSLFRQLMKEIEEWYWKNVITASQFSGAGALQLETDIKFGLWKIGQRWVNKPENYTKRLKEAIQLLTLPFEQQSGTDSSSCGDLMRALSDTSQLEFIQKMLDKLGIEVLSNGQIRDVLRRRNDMLYSWS
ncbi:RAD50-interacting protein 1 [Choanephora cucurbitarum]|uniref:RAD50-interacting protein 1 n=1 Tax=Choanephora cucurbitarum TaxID=101091 RepID=A0A1C7NRL6_9FUNG|nr:RAD50-interacting protein 1 [Choanephora cucurbitarum]